MESYSVLSVIVKLLIKLNILSLIWMSFSMSLTVGSCVGLGTIEVLAG